MTRRCLFKDLNFSPSSKQIIHSSVTDSWRGTAGERVDAMTSVGLTEAAFLRLLDTIVISPGSAAAGMWFFFTHALTIFAVASTEGRHVVNPDG